MFARLCKLFPEALKIIKAAVINESIGPECPNHPFAGLLVVPQGPLDDLARANQVSFAGHEAVNQLLHREAINLLPRFSTGVEIPSCFW